MHPSMTSGRPRNAIGRERTKLKVAARKRALLQLRDDEASEWLAPETIVAQAFHEEARIGRLLPDQRRRKPFIPEATGLAMSIVAVVFTAAILLTLVA